MIVWSEEASTLRIPNADVAILEDCSNKFQTCLTDHRGFVFSYFRDCAEVDNSRLSYRPKIVAAIHNDLWMVFDAAPNYMFHYSIHKGVVGIYVGATPSFDFRHLLRSQHMRLDKFDALEYRLVSAATIAECKFK